jgi:cytochrome b pre-mRNA-processing protein 3
VTVAKVAASSETPKGWWFGRARRERRRVEPLYRRIVAIGRDPVWYRDCGVPDTLDGRFDMLTAILALVLVRLEEEDKVRETVLLAETFIEEMEGTIRQIGIGDLMVGKQVGKMMSALGGRIEAFRAGDLDAAIRRNIFHDAAVDEARIQCVRGRLEEFRGRLSGRSADALLEAEI